MFSALKQASELIVPSTTQVRYMTKIRHKYYRPWQRHPQTSGASYRGESKGHGYDIPRVKVSKTMSWLLRHGAKMEGIPVRPDGYILVQDLLRHPSLRHVDLPTIERVIKEDKKGRYHMYCEQDGKVFEAGSNASDAKWWICATQGHSMTGMELDLRRISADEVPMAVHGTTEQAWKSISTMGLSRMTRQHIHLAQGVPREKGVISGMRNSSRILIYIDLEKAMAVDIKFYLSRNGVILTPGNDAGILEPRFFSRVERLSKNVSLVPGFEGPASLPLDGAVDVPLPEEKLRIKGEEDSSRPDFEQLIWKPIPKDELTII